ncbi:hypothetical protein TrLO_g8200 [Triparma laevis f. longispina]|uniref:Uncharacterized protein n=1 Tax=Triparma laevis f. longispina TaxID=1714387 RepID=A0A9W6ZCF5_9STRA|nr:hypothetical protein TrLO_g8200 [Triparma laevis f. longispina]
MSFLRKKKKDTDSASGASQAPQDDQSGFTSGTGGRPVITCAILLMEAPNSIDSTTPAGRKKFEVLQVSFTQDATTKSVLENVKLQSSHNPNSLSATCIGLCRPGGSEFVNSFAIKKYEVQQNELLLGIPDGITAAATARHSENMRRSSKLKALLKSMEITPLQSPDTESSAGQAVPVSPSYIVYAAPKKSRLEKEEEERKAQEAAEDDASSKLEVTGVEEIAHTNGSLFSALSDSPAKAKAAFEKVKNDPNSLSLFGKIFVFLLLWTAVSMFVERRTDIADLEFGLAPGTELSHIALMKTVPIADEVVVSEDPENFGKQLQAATSKAAVLFAGQVKTVVKPQSLSSPPSKLNKSLAPSVLSLKLDTSGLLSLSEKGKVIWSQTGKPGDSLLVDPETNQMKLGKSLVIVDDAELRSSWPFAGYMTGLYSNPVARQVIGLAVTVAGAFILRRGLNLVFGLFRRSAASGAAAKLPKKVTGAAAAKKVAAKKPAAKVVKKVASTKKR